MKIIVTFGLCFLLVLCSFVICFADTYAASLLPVSEPSYSSVFSSFSQVNYLTTSDKNVLVHFASDSPNTFISLLDIDGSYTWVVMTPDPGVTLYRASNVSQTVTQTELTNYSNGYYFTSSIGSNLVADNTTLPINEATSIQSFLEGFFDHNSVVFNLTDLVSASVSWLSSMAQAVKANGLLLFFVLSIFVGVSIGLLNRFRKE